MPHKDPAAKLAYMAEYRRRKAADVAASIARWREANPDYDRSRYQHSKEQTLEANRIWREANLDRRAAYRRAWNAANPEYKNAWIAANRGRVMAQQARRRAAKLRATVAWSDPAAIRTIYEHAAVLRAQGLDVEVDHVVPLQGKNVCGLHVANNLEIIPMRANRSKANKLVAA